MPVHVQRVYLVCSVYNTNYKHLYCLQWNMLLYFDLPMTADAHNSNGRPEKLWRQWDLNPQPSYCWSDALPLSYIASIFQANHHSYIHLAALLSGEPLLLCASSVIGKSKYNNICDCKQYRCL